MQYLLNITMDKVPDKVISQMVERAVVDNIVGEAEGDHEVILEVADDDGVWSLLNRWSHLTDEAAIDAIAQVMATPGVTVEEAVASIVNLLAKTGREV